MTRSIFYRKKGDALWNGVAGVPPFEVKGLEPNTTYEVDDGTGIREITTGPAVGLPESSPTINSRPYIISSGEISEDQEFGTATWNGEVDEVATRWLVDGAVVAEADTVTPVAAQYEGSLTVEQQALRGDTWSDWESSEPIVISWQAPQAKGLEPVLVEVGTEIDVNLRAGFTLPGDFSGTKLAITLADGALPEGVGIVDNRLRGTLTAAAAARDLTIRATNPDGDSADVLLSVEVTETEDDFGFTSIDKWTWNFKSIKENSDATIKHGDNQTLTVTSEQLADMNDGPVFLKKPTLSWLSGDGRSAGDVVGIDLGRVGLQGETYTTTWSLTDEAGAVLASGTDAAPATHVLASGRAGETFTLTRTVEDSLGTVEATATLNASNIDPNVVAPAVFNGSNYYERRPNDWSAIVYPVVGRLFVLQSARSDQDTPPKHMIWSASDRAQGISYGYRQFRLTYSLDGTSSGGYISLIDGMTTADPTTALVLLSQNGDGTSRVQWAVNDGEIWSGKSETIQGNVDLPTDVDWGIARDPRDPYDHENDSGELFKGTLYRAGIWDFGPDEVFPDLTSDELRSTLVDSQGVVTDATLFDDKVNGYRIWDKYTNWDTGEHAGLVSPFNSNRHAEYL